MDKETLRTRDHAIVTFRFMFHPEYIRAGAKFMFREGKTKGTGVVKEAIFIPKGSELSTQAREGRHQQHQQGGRASMPETANKTSGTPARQHRARTRPKGETTTPTGWATTPRDYPGIDRNHMDSNRPQGHPAAGKKIKKNAAGYARIQFISIGGWRRLLRGVMHARYGMLFMRYARSWSLFRSNN